jgi:hypothetical protein
LDLFTSLVNAFCYAFVYLFNRGGVVNGYIQGFGGADDGVADGRHLVSRCSFEDARNVQRLHLLLLIPVIVGGRWVLGLITHVLMRKLVVRALVLGTRDLITNILNAILDWRSPYRVHLSLVDWLLVFVESFCPKVLKIPSTSIRWIVDLLNINGLSVLLLLVH